MDPVSAINRLTEPDRARIMLMIAVGDLTALTDGAGVQGAQVALLAGELADNARWVQNYGFASKPLGGKCVVIFPGGNRDHPIIVGIDDPASRPGDLKPGEVCVFTDEGDRITLKRGNQVEIKTKTLVVKAEEKVRFETPLLEVLGQIIDLAENGGVQMSEMRAIFDAHTHKENDARGQTDAPEGKMGGS